MQIPPFHGGGHILIKIRKKLFGTPIPKEEHTKNKTLLKGIDDKLDICRSKELEYKEKQKQYMMLKAQQEELKRKIEALEGKYKEAVLMSGEL